MSVFSNDIMLVGKDAVEYIVDVYYTRAAFLAAMASYTEGDMTYGSFEGIAQKVTYSINNEQTDANVWNNRVKRRITTGEDFRINLSGFVGGTCTDAIRIAEFIRMVHAAKEEAGGCKGPWIIIQWDEGSLDHPLVVGGIVESVTWERGNDIATQEMTVLADGIIANLPS